MCFKTDFLNSATRSFYIFLLFYCINCYTSISVGLTAPLSPCM